MFPLTELVPVWRSVGIPQAGSRSVGRSYTPPGTAPAWYARHDSDLSSAASLSFLLTDRIVDEKTVKSKRNGTEAREGLQFPISLWPYRGVILSKNMTHFRALFPSSFIKSLDHLISMAP